MNEKICDGWGEFPKENFDLDIPYFVRSEYKEKERKQKEAAEMKKAIAKSKKERKKRTEQRRKRNAIVGFVGFIILCFMFYLANTLMEIIC